MDAESIMEAEAYILQRDMLDVSCSYDLARMRLIDIYNEFVYQKFGIPKPLCYSFKVKGKDLSSRYHLSLADSVFDERWFWDDEVENARPEDAGDICALGDFYEDVRADYFESSPYWSVEFSDYDEFSDIDEEDYNTLDSYCYVTTLRCYSAPKFYVFCQNHIPVDKTERELLRLYDLSANIILDEAPRDCYWSGAKESEHQYNADSFISVIMLGLIEDNDRNPVISSYHVNPSLNLCGWVMDRVIEWFDKKYNILRKEE